MTAVVSSKHIRSTNELMLVVPVKQGFVAHTDRLTSYATRLQFLLNTLTESGRLAAEETLIVNDGPIDQLGAIYNTQWAVVDKPQQAQLFVSAVFDRSWEEYFNLLVDVTGPLLDLIFCHCVGYKGHTCEDGYEKFAEWIRRHQVQTSFFHTELRDLTVDDLRLTRERIADPSSSHEPLRRLETQAKKAYARAAARSPGLKAELHERRKRGYINLHLLRGLFTDTPEELAPRTAQGHFDKAVIKLFNGDELAETAADAKTLPDDVAHWVTGLNKQAGELKQASVAGAVRLTPSDLDDIQGNLLTAYHDIYEGEIALVSCNAREDAAALLDDMATRVRPQSRAGDANKELSVNIAVTYQGLRRLNLDPALLAQLPQEFREGMEARAALVGDVGQPNHPVYWERPVLDSGDTLLLDSVDFVVWLEGGTSKNRAEVYDKLAQHHVVVLHKQALKRPKKNETGQWADVFGFVDPGDRHTGSQPEPHAILDQDALFTDATSRDTVNLGEFLLGYPDRRGHVARCAQPGAAGEKLFRNGSFLVLRKLEMHRTAFQEWKRFNQGKTDGSSIVGRDTSGRPLDNKAARDNDFAYKDDPNGARCPLHAHIRRANPRNHDLLQANEEIPRIMRRSFSYNDNGHEGLIFLAYNASIAGQFEVIQRWLNGGNITGLLSAQNDVLTGATPSALPIAGAEVDNAQLRAPTKPLVSLRWGLYLFTPSVTGLRELAKAANAPAPRQIDAVLLSRGRARIAELDAIADPAQARMAWQQLLEEDAWVDEARAVWAVLRSERQSKHTPYATLVGDLDNARAILCDDGRRFSVREYRGRLREFIGEHYLGFDEKPGTLRGDARSGRDEEFEALIAHCPHSKLAAVPNDYIYDKLLVPDVFEVARQAAAGYLNLKQHQRPHFADLSQFAGFVVGQVTKAFIGLPDGVDDPVAVGELLRKFIAISSCSFQPYPEDALRAQASAAGKALRAAYQKNPPKSAMYLNLCKQLDNPEQAQIAVIGAIVGFAAPAIGVIIKLASTWLQTGELKRQRQLLEGIRDPKTRAEHLRAPLLAALQVSPVPPILYRTVVEPFAQAQPGELVVVGLQSVAIDAAQQNQVEPWQWLFGGAHASDNPERLSVHGCPGRLQVEAALLGVLVELLSCCEPHADSLLKFSYHRR